MKKSNFNLRIGRYSFSSDGNFGYIEVVDNKSRCHLLNIELSKEDYVNLMCGEDFIGLNCVSEPREVVFTGDSTIKHDIDKLKEQIIENCQEEGYFLNIYLGSRDSKVYKDGRLTLKYRVTKYVKDEE